jgi:predicted ATPase
MKVGFIGVGGTGKSSTIELLRDLGIPVLESVSRAVFKEWGWKEKDQRDAEPEVLLSFQRAIFDRKIAQEQGMPSFLSDRTLLDHLSYCFFRAGSALTEQQAKEMIAITEESLRQYDLLFFFSYGLFNPPDDGVREHHYVSSILIDSIMRGLLHRFAQAYFEVPMGSVESRAAFIKDRIVETSASQGGY